MTKATVPYSFAAAARRTIEGIGWDKAVQMIGPKSRATLQAWCDGDNPRLPRIDQALALEVAYSAAGGDGYPFLDAFQIALTAACDGREACHTRITAKVANIAKDSGELIAAAIPVTRTDANPREIRRALVEAEDLGSGVDGLVYELKMLLRRDAGSVAMIAGGAL
jgi:hypothetical protein